MKAGRKEMTFGVVGSGKLATSLIMFLSAKKMLSWISVRSSESLEKTSKTHAVPVYKGFDRITYLPDVIIFAVSDDAIEEVAEKTASHFNEKLNGKLIIHCSGTVSPEVLSTCTKYGAKTGVAHPYQTFYYPSADLFDGIAWAVDSESYETVKPVVELLNGKPFPLNLKNPEIRGKYHASAVIASNFMNILVETGRALLAKTGLPEADFLAPIIKTTVESNIRSLSENGVLPLTGPYARNDLQAIALHAESLNSEPELKEIYGYLARAVALTLKVKGLIDKETLSKIFNQI